MLPERTLRRPALITLAIVAFALIGLSLWQLQAATAGLDIRRLTLGGAPATVYAPAAGPPGPVVVIAHGFAGSQQLMQAFAVALAGRGYVAVTYDLSGHGRNPAPLSGDVTKETGATRTLVAELERVAAAARPLGDGRLAVLGHSMASDIVVRFAKAHPEVTATVAVSMFSREVTATEPRNLLVIVGDWEGFLKSEALRAVGLAVPAGAAEPGRTYGDPAAGTGRRAAFAPFVEHVGVLYSPLSLREAADWLDATFARPSPPDWLPGHRGLWFALLIAGIIALARPVAELLPVVTPDPAGAGLGWKTLGPLLAAAAVGTPLILRVLPTHVLPVLVADYIAAHFAMFGLLMAAGLALVRRRSPAKQPPARLSVSALALGAALWTLYTVGAFGSALDSYAVSFVPPASRGTVIAALLVGTGLYFLSDEWLTRGPGAARFAYPVAKLAFLLSLALAVSLDFGRLFFLVIVMPVILLLFLVFGLLSRWAYRRTNHPFVPAIANAAFFATAIGVTFPMLSG
jgi:pimeloyl-ACP methyl ester carboxylesterase